MIFKFYYCGFEEVLDLQILRSNNVGSHDLLPWSEDEGKTKIRFATME
jgi:hypothetical protein